ncbi:uncharacterized protein K460DRAFT_115859 [Cucurbitaria berberidis CBS 394.84]|uniref:Uncharacterized protein n=1 Tax=Cucurbitaria berberidis CBS 394.84 TaxID=1168544 RepID=A0A9P4GIG8_9PLEO|nr:uncharacterized protein K460DRAFT_115859 [Cucurbitaria berberidis CBS 394.84]KAF1845829.1 hypothetical protein K460DRAFT_115859 [Cucurbitaria berberidis CBS 394.84]
MRRGVESSLPTTGSRAMAGMQEPERTESMRVRPGTAFTFVPTIALALAATSSLFEYRGRGREESQARAWATVSNELRNVKGAGAIGDCCTTLKRGHDTGTKREGCSRLYLPMRRPPTRRGCLKPERGTKTRQTQCAVQRCWARMGSGDQFNRSWDRVWSYLWLISGVRS